MLACSIISEPVVRQNITAEGCSRIQYSPHGNQEAKRTERRKGPQQIPKDSLQ
jgi:hypothetical protein